MLYGKGNQPSVIIFKTKWFTRFARQQGISDAALREAVQRAERGLIDADLGGGVIKQRIARPNEGRSGGFRSIVLFRAGERANFIFGFAKNTQDNIGAEDLKRFRDAAQVFFNYTTDELETAIKTNALTEVDNDDENLQE